VFDQRYFTAPSPTLWFVPLLLQYYLLFPALLAVLKRVGPVMFAVLAFAVSVGSTWWLIWEYDSLGLHPQLWGAWFPFRGFEFAVGMAIGYVLLERPSLAHRLSAAWPTPIAIVIAGVALHTVGSMLDDRDGYWNAFGYPLLTAGFAAVMFVVLTVRPGFVLSSAPFRLIAWIGVISYTVLIVNESFFHMNKYLIIEGYQWSAGWWFFVVVLYVPVTVLLAYPLAVVLGLTGKPTWWPRWSFARRRVPAIPAAAESAQAGG
jgi:peptidoglycan/LPS O-acetylase OafA/YrhL